MNKYISRLLYFSALTALISIVDTANAALPPGYQSAREFRALLDSPTLTEDLGSAEALKSITRDDKGFIVKTTKYTIRVDVIYDPMDHPGPAKFHLSFHNREVTQ